jgi:putative transposase
VLVRRLATENPTWGAPRVHGELRRLGFNVSERTVSHLMPRRTPKPEAVQRWMMFLRNHRDAIAAMDFFVVPTVTFRILYVWFVIGHGRRRIVHFHVTDHPDAAWVAQQLREAFPFDTTLDRARRLHAGFCADPAVVGRLYPRDTPGSGVVAKDR